jgi:hypothetical protein
MSARSQQAHRLARALSSQTGIPVEAVYDDRTRHYLVQWGNGPTADGMSVLVVKELGTGAYPSLPARILNCARGYTPRAFAASAVAATRDSSLAQAVERGAAERRRIEATRPSWSKLTHEELAAHDHIERLLEVTPYPDRPDDLADQPLIDRLLHLSGSNEYQMIAALLDPASMAWSTSVQAAESTPEAGA